MVLAVRSVNQRSATILRLCKRLRLDLSGAEYARRSRRYEEVFQRRRRVKEGRKSIEDVAACTLSPPESAFVSSLM